MLRRFLNWLRREQAPEDIQCPECGYYCAGKGGAYCIDKPAMVEFAVRPPEEWQLRMESIREQCRKNRERVNEMAPGLAAYCGYPWK